LHRVLANARATRGFSVATIASASR
jgi:hypothetical protein